MALQTSVAIHKNLCKTLGSSRMKFLVYQPSLSLHNVRAYADLQETQYFIITIFLLFEFLFLNKNKQS